MRGTMKKLKRYGGLFLLCGALACGNFSSAIVLAGATEPVVSADETSGDFVPSTLPSPEFSAEAGFYEEEFLLALTVPKGFEIYLTTDGSVPSPENASAFCYTEPLLLTDLRTDNVAKAWVIRAAAFSPEGGRGDIVTKTYFIGQGMTSRYQVPVVSLVTDPDNLYDEKTGIYANYWESGREWERPFHFEYFTPEGELAVSLNCGGRVHGGASREIEMKSLRLYARAEYDVQKNFKYDFFAGGTLPARDINGNPIKKFKHLILRGGGNEATAWERVYFRDTLTAWCMRNTGLDVQAAQPLVAFLNGNYYGIMNLRERQDERYVEEHYGLDNTQIAVYSFWYDEDGNFHVEADADSDELAWQEKQYYEEIFRFATTADLTVPENYAKVCEVFDIENYIDYLCVELFCDNTDWPGNNCKAWRYMGAGNLLSGKDETFAEEKNIATNGLYGSDGKIRWFLYDTEFAFGLYGRQPDDDSIAAALSSTSKEWPNQHGSTLLFRSLLQNEDFYNAFVSRMLDLMNEVFVSKALNAQVDLMADYYKDLIRENRDAGNWFDSYENNLSVVKSFINKRPAYFYTMLYRHFALGARYTLHIDFDTSMGSLSVGTITAAEGANCIRDGGFYGYYYNEYPVEVTALPAKGYRFVGFTGKGISALATADGTRIDPADAQNSALLHYTAEDGSDAILYTQNKVFVQNQGADGQVYLTAVFEKEDASPSYIEKVGAAAGAPSGADGSGAGLPEGAGTDGQQSGISRNTGADGQQSGISENTGADKQASGMQESAGANGQPDVQGNAETDSQQPGAPENPDHGPDSSAAAKSQNADSAEFILLCILLAAALGFVTFLGVRASRRRFRR